MSKEHRKHFEDYRAQTRLKHEILKAYMPPFFHILGKYVKNLVYIDAFAGRGTYSDHDVEAEVPGSPLLALELIAEDQSLADKVSTVFVEADKQNFERLDSTVAEFRATHPNIREPSLKCGTFADAMEDVLRNAKSLAPTFLFVDPCGISGASFATIKRVMEHDKCEAFIFFNLEAVRRVAGLAEVNDHLVELYGSRERAEAIVEAMRTTNDVRDREDFIIAEYRRACIEDMSAKYVVAFRVEREKRKTTSHFFVHVTKHHLGFAIMKDVMWPLGRTDDGPGGLEFIQASETDIEPLMKIGWEQLKDEIVESLSEEPVKVETFYKDWVYRPDDKYCESAYRQALIELEAEGRIEVLDKDGSTPTPAKSRPKPRGRVTMAKSRHVRLPLG